MNKLPMFFIIPHKTYSDLFRYPHRIFLQSFKNKPNDAVARELIQCSFYLRLTQPATLVIDSLYKDRYRIIF